MIALLCGAPRASLGQERGFAVDRFEPAERGSDWFSLDALDFRGNGRLAVGIVGDWAHKPLVAYDASGQEVAVPIRDQVVLHAGAAITLADRIRLGVNVPILLVNDGDASVVNGRTLAAPSGSALGDLRFAADLRLVGTYRSPFQLALGARAFLASGDTAAYSGDGRMRAAPQLMAAGDIGPIVYAVRTALQWRGARDPVGSGATGDELLLSAALGIRAAEGRLVIGPEIYGSSVVSEADSFFSRRSTPFEMIFGAHYLIADAWRLGAGVGPGLTRGYGSPALRVLAGLEWAPAPEPPPSDRDRDGVLDTADACVEVPGVPTNDPATNGCPPPPPPRAPLDSDRDGIADNDDACFDVPGVRTEDPRTNGCPPPPPDRDKDGVLDPDDACPDVAGQRSGDPKQNGCPPPDPDRDKDGVANEKDACPDEPGVASADPKKNGCPTGAIVGDQIVILDQVQFKTASDVILPASETVLQKVLDTMNKLPDAQKFRIEGHTDNRGTIANNRALSKRRAQAVVRWMVKHGATASRFEAVGLGPDRPTAGNDTDEGRQQNRRVEFHLVGAPSTDAKSGAQVPPGEPR